METNIENPKTENGNTGAWFNKNNWKDMRLIFNPEETPPEGFVRAQPLHGLDYQLFDEETGEWVADPHAEQLAKIDACKKELAAIDREAGAGRTVRGLALAATEKAGVTGENYDRLREYESRAEKLRARINTSNRPKKSRGTE